MLTNRGIHIILTQMKSEIDGVTYDLGDLLLEGYQGSLGNRGWHKMEEFGLFKEIGLDFFLESLRSSNVDVLRFGTNNKFGYYNVEQLVNQKKAILDMGVEFEFSGGPYAPFMKIEIEGEKSLIFKFFRNMESDKGSKGCNGGLILVSPQYSVISERNWLRHITTGVDRNNFALVLGNNPTEKKEGGNYYALSYRKVFNLQEMRVPYSNLNP